jgi:hypothetical protein
MTKEMKKSMEDYMVKVMADRIGPIEDQLGEIGRQLSALKPSKANKNEEKEEKEEPPAAKTPEDPFMTLLTMKIEEAGNNLIDRAKTEIDDFTKSRKLAMQRDGSLKVETVEVIDPSKTETIEAPASKVHKAEKDDKSEDLEWYQISAKQHNRDQIWAFAAKVGLAVVLFGGVLYGVFWLIGKLADGTTVSVSETGETQLGDVSESADFRMAS